MSIGTSSARVFTFGEALATIDVNPSHASVGSVSVAGAELNTAAGLARLGHPVAWFSRVADDAFGELVMGALHAEGIDASSVVRVQGAKTGLIVRSRIDDHEMRSEHYRSGSAASAMTTGDLDSEALDGVRWMHATAITPSLGAGPRTLFSHVIRDAARRGIPVSLDTNHRPQLVDEAGLRAVVDEVLTDVDTLFCNEHEALVLTGSADPREALARLVARGPGTVVVKLGRRGALASVRGRVLATGAWPVQPPTHPVGAGDSFNAAWIAAMIRGVDPGAALALAAWSASRVVSHPSDHGGFPRAAEFAEMARSLGSRTATPPLLDENEEALLP